MLNLLRSTPTERSPLYVGRGSTGWHLLKLETRCLNIQLSFDLLDSTITDHVSTAAYPITLNSNFEISSQRLSEIILNFIFEN